MTHPTDRSAVLDDLRARRLVADATDLGALRAEMSAGRITCYAGFDPTAASLHIGNLLQILTLRRLQLAGHRVLGLVGGATGLIGDPKQAGERVLNPLEVVEAWGKRFRAQLERLLDFDGPNPAVLVNNYEWTSQLLALDFLRDIGKHFSVNRMLAREVVRSRLDSGISYTEFSYVLLQSMDFLELYRRYGCTLQTGGSDQWGNITAGVELIRRIEGARVHALATPLITRVDGTKYGKTAGGETVWLDAELTSPYAFYQFWFNVDDADAGTLLRSFTFRPLDEVAVLEKATAEQPHERAAQRALAADVTTLVHGAEQTRSVRAAAQALFGRGNLRELDGATLLAALREAPHAEGSAGDSRSYVELLVASGLAASKSEARRVIADGGGYLNNAKVTDPDYVPTPSDRLPGGCLVLRRGKRSVGGVVPQSRRADEQLTPSGE